MAVTHFEDRLLNAVHDVEVAAVDTGRKIAHHVYDMVPVVATDMTHMTDATFDFTGRMLELQLEVTHELFARMREVDVSPPVTRKPTARAKKASTTKKAA